MRNKIKEEAKYNLKYPYHLPWDKAQWCVQAGDILVDGEGNKRRVKGVISTTIPGDAPKLEFYEDAHADG